MNYKIAICDDENKDIEKLSSHINCYSFDIDTKIEIFPFISGNDLYHSCENGASYDIIFIDIEMPNCNGIEIARKIKILTTESLIVFVSNYPEYMQESFSAHPYFFLQKPINRSQIFQILDDSIEHMKKNNSHIVIVNNNGINVVVHLNTLMYIESTNSKDKNLRFHTTKEDIATKGIIKEWIERLEPYGFICCYRGIIINLKYVHFLYKRNVTLTDGSTFPISRDKEQNLNHWYINKIIKLRR